MKQLTLAILGLTTALAISACSTGAALPTATPPAVTALATSVPTLAPATPTVPPATPTAVPTTAATATPAVVPTAAPTDTPATSASAATNSDFAQTAGAISAATSYRMTIVTNLAAQNQSANIVVEVVKPDRIHNTVVSNGRTLETITIGTVTYLKAGATWTKSPIAMPPQLSSVLLNNDPQKLLTQLESSQKGGTVTKGTIDQVNGTACQEWLLTGTGTSATSSGGSLCIATQTNLPVQFKSTDGRVTVTYSDWNTPISIVAPI